MALSVKTKARMRGVIFLVLCLGVGWVVFSNWDRILPAIGAGTEKAFDAAREVSGEAP